MSEFLTTSAYFGVSVSLLAYYGGVVLQRKTKLAFFNPLLLSIVMTVLVLVVGKIPYPTYNEGAKYLSYLLTPATVCLAVPLYEKLKLLRDNWKAILLGILSGVLTSLLCVLVMAFAFGFTHEEYVTFLPKSITTAIGMGVAEELGGYGTLAASVIIVTGVIGNMIAPAFLKLARITDPVAKGIGIGSASHAVGTAKAMELGETEGAMSSLSIVVSGLLTVIGASIFAGLL